MKKFLRYLIMFSIAIGLLSANIITSLAYSEIKYGDYMYYCVENSVEVTITDCDNAATEIVIPSEIDGKPVTHIDDNAFSDCSSLTSIAIPDTVVSIGSFAFSGCDSLTSITIPGSVTSMGYYSFSNCKNLTDITIPKSIRRIGNNAFSRCDKLKRVNISDIDAWCGIKFVNDTSNPLCNGGKLYINNKVVTKITLSDSVTKIGDYAFYNCSSLIYIIMPNTVTSIGNGAFSRCDSLTSITIPESVSSCEITCKLQKNNTQTAKT